MTDTEALRESIASHGFTLTYVAKTLNISREALYNKLNGTSEFWASEILALRKLLNLSPSEFNAIFFTG